MEAAALNSTSGTQKVCFNSNCKAVLDRVSNGWRRRTGEFAELCDRCSSVYEAGNFCETFHLNSSGWRCCESCGKQIHCGCIVSFHMFVLLDPGGIECLTCARKSFILTPNPAWPPPSLFLPVQVQPERIKELSTKNWPAIVGSGPVPWRQAPSVFNATSVQSDLQVRMPNEFEKHRFHERLSSPPVERRKMEESLDRLMNGSLKISCSGVIGGGAPVAKCVEHPTSSRNLFQLAANSKTLGSTSSLVTTFKPEASNHHPMVVRTIAPLPTVVYPQAEKRFSGQNQADVFQTERRSSGQNQVDVSQTERRSSGQNQADVSQTERLYSGSDQTADVSQSEKGYSGQNLVDVFQTENRPSGQNQVDVFHTEKRPSDQNQVDLFQTEKRPSGQNLADVIQTEKRSSGQNQADVSEAQQCNGKARGGDVRGRPQFLPRYWPRISEEELQKISENSNSVITPLFEKMLSASDAGRIGRLVLPKKCAEAYFPPISQPEGVPLKIQDLKGQEWVFQFRFWPNNNSRMYVLEGIMPCIQSMQLQAGDIVTFSRIEPEGKLVMGCRKVLSVAEKGNETPSNAEGLDKGKKVGELGSIMQGDTVPSPSLQLPSQQTAEPAGSTLCEDDKHGVDVVKANTSVRGKRRNSTIGLRNKRLRIDSDDAFELKMSWEQVQGLLRPSADKSTTVCVVEGCEFEEYEEGPLVIGRPTIPDSDRHGRKVQWVQCEKCFKWRKVPTDALLKSQWICSDNLWDPPRSRCSADEELTADKLEALLTITSNGPSEKRKGPKPDPETLEALEGLDALAELAIQEKAASFSSPSQPPASSRHPRHKPGCSCIVCIQPPSGKGPKHKQPCDCVVCKSVKRRFETLMLKREQKLSWSEKEPEPESGPESDMIMIQDKEDRVAGGRISKEMRRMAKMSLEKIENSGEDRRFAAGRVINKEMQRMAFWENIGNSGMQPKLPNMSPEIMEDSGEDRRFVTGDIMNKKVQQTPEILPENTEESGEDLLAGGMITSTEEMQPTQKMSPKTSENSGEDRFAGGIITSMEEIEPTQKMSPKTSENPGEDRFAGGIITSTEMQSALKTSENLSAGDTILENDTKEMLQRSPEHISETEQHSSNHISSPNNIMTSVAQPNENSLISSPNGVVASVTPAD